MGLEKRVFLSTVKGMNNRMGWGPFTLSASHPFSMGAELLHDPVYQSYLDGNATTEDLIKADKAYYSYMKGVANGSISLQLQAHVFYAIIKIFRLTARMPGKAPMPPE